MIVDRTQRWKDRRDSFVPCASTIVAADYAVDVIDCHRAAKPFVERHHYSGSFPASRMSVGLFRNSAGGTSQLVGVATFSQPMNNASVPLHTGLDDPRQGADLGRLVLLDDVPGNGETWFLSRAFRALRREKPSILSVVSYADPMTRRAPDGSLTKPGHVGGVYAVMDASYRGRTRPRMETVTPDGQLFSERAMAKIRNGETGRDYAARQLVDRGADPQGGADGREWIAGLVSSGFLSKRRHNGNHVYVFELTRAARMAGRDRPRLAYPRMDRSSGMDDVTSLPLLRAA
jgi:hypothetical protein